MHIQTLNAFVDFQKLCSFPSPAIQPHVISNAVYPAKSDIPGHSSAVLARRYAPLDIFEHGRLDLGNVGTCKANFVWIPLKVRQFTMGTIPIRFPTSVRFRHRKHVDGDDAIICNSR